MDVLLSDRTDTDGHVRTAGQPCVDGPASIIPQMLHMLSFPFAAAPRDGARSAVAGLDSGGEGAGGREREREKGRERSDLVWAHKEGKEGKAGQLWTDPNYFFSPPPPLWILVRSATQT